MNSVFVIADTHFGHAKVIDFEKEHRPFATIEEHDDELVRRWNDSVGTKDTVWHLGDVLFGSAAFATLGKLNGLKKLVMGNHDTQPMNLYMEHFTKICSCAVYDGYLLSHVPVHPGQFGRFDGNIHGHMHSGKLPDERYICVSAELTGLTPLKINPLITRNRRVRNSLLAETPALKGFAEY